MKKLLFLTLISLLGLAMFFSCTTKQEENIKILRVAILAEPPSLDPSLSHDVISFSQLYAMQEGLYRHHNGKYIPGIAKGEPEVSEDGLEWTFNLRDAIWNDSIPVTAHDFEYSWKRTITASTGAKYSFIITDYVKGALEYFEGKGSIDDVMIKSINDSTLVVTLKRPTPYFKSLTSFATFFPQRKDIVEKYGKGYATEADKMIFNGPFILTEWLHENRLVFEKNKKYWNSKAINLDKVISPKVKDIQTRVALYETGELDLTDLSRDFVKMYEEKGELKSYLNGGSMYLMLNGTKIKALKNKNIRKALSYSIDRNSHIKNVFQLPHISSNNIVNPVIMGYKQKFRKEFVGNYFELYNPEKAKQLFDEGMKEEGLTKFPVLEYLTFDSEKFKISAEFIQEGWRKILGIEIRITPLPFKIKLEKITRFDFEISFSGWSPDYDDPMTFLDMWTTGNAFNGVKYSNISYDALIEEAKSILDNKRRMELMAKAEEIIIEDLPIIPLYHATTVYTIRKGIKNLHRGVFGADVDWIYADIVNEVKK